MNAPPGTNPVLDALDVRAAEVERVLVSREQVGGYAYPDRENRLEDMVFTFQKRRDEARVWAELVSMLFGTERPLPGLALDAGCGLGGHVELLSTVFTHPFFVDADEERLVAAREQFERPFFHIDLSDPSWVRGLEGRFRFVQCVQVLGHVPHEAVDPTLGALRRALEPGGALLVGVPFTGAPFDDFWITFLDGEQPRPMLTDARKFDRLARHPEPHRLPVRHFALGTLIEHVQRAGFEVVVHKPYNWFSDVRGDLFLAARVPTT